MQYLDKLKKDRSKDRVIFLVGMVLSFIGFLLPVFHDEEGLYNVFSGAAAYNIAGSAQCATFLVAAWLCSIAGIILFFATHSIVGDVLVWLLGAGFGIAETVALILYVYDPNPFGFYFVGTYVTFIGWIIALVGTVLGAAHIKAPEIGAKN